MKKPFLMIVQVNMATPGRLARKLNQRGYALDIRCPLAGDELPATLAEHAGAVVLGGPMSANDDTTVPGLRAELDWIPHALASGKPFLGICLGAQLLARALGARVAPHPDGLAEIGYFPVQPTAAGAPFFTEPLYVYHWHCEGLELPREAVLLAEGERFPNQAYRYGDNAFGIQFHPEVSADMMEDWLQRTDPRLALPGAQPSEQHRVGRDRYDMTFARWFDHFLHLWLKDS